MPANLNGIEQEVNSRCYEERTLQEILASMDRDKKIVLLGAGRIGRIALRDIKNEGYEVDYFVDNDPSKIGSHIEGVLVIAPIDLVPIASEVQALVACQSTLSFIKQLNRLHIAEVIRGTFPFIEHERKQIRITEDGKVTLLRVYYEISYECNLRCEYCLAFSPFRKGTVSSEELFDSFSVWSRRLAPVSVGLMGGEPLLNPHFKEIVLEAVKQWNQSNVVIVTNGILLSQLDDAFLALLSGRNISFSISQHIDSEEFRRKLDREVARFQANGITVFVSSLTRRWQRTYITDEHNRPRTSNSKIKDAWRTCMTKICPVIAGREMIFCHWLAGAQHAVREKSLAPEWKDILLHQGISVESTPQEIISYLKKGAVPECRFCPEENEIVQIRQLTPEQIRIALDY